MCATYIRTLAAVSFWLVVSSVQAGGVDFTNPPQGVFVDDWAVVYLNGQKCGFSQTVLTRKGDTISTMMLQSFKIGRAGTGLEATS